MANETFYLIPSDQKADIYRQISNKTGIPVFNELNASFAAKGFSGLRIDLVDETYPDSEFAQGAIAVPTVNPERTFLEKIFLLHEEFQRPAAKMRVDRLSRNALLQALVCARACAA